MKQLYKAEKDQKIIIWEVVKFSALSKFLNQKCPLKKVNSYARKQPLCEWHIEQSQ